MTKDNTDENSSAKKDLNMSKNRNKQKHTNKETQKQANEAKTVSLKTSKSYDSDTYFFFMCVYGLGFS